MRRSSLSAQLKPFLQTAKLLSPGIFGRKLSSNHCGIVPCREVDSDEPVWSLSADKSVTWTMDSLGEVCKRRGRSVGALRIV